MREKTSQLLLLFSLSFLLYPTIVQSQELNIDSLFRGADMDIDSATLVYLKNKYQPDPINQDSVQGFYKTYEDYKKGIVSDTVDLYFGLKTLYIRTLKDNGKLNLTKFTNSTSSYWGAKVYDNNMSTDFRFMGFKTLAILTIGDINIYSEGYIGETGIQIETHNPSSHSTNGVNKLGCHNLVKKGTDFDGSLSLRMAAQVNEIGQEYYREMCYIQKGIGGQLLTYSKTNKNKLVALFKGCDEVQQSFQKFVNGYNYEKYRGIKYTTSIAELYMHIVMYNNCTK